MKSVLHPLDCILDLFDGQTTPKSGSHGKPCLVGSKLHGQDFADGFDLGSPARVSRMTLILSRFVRSPVSKAPVSRARRTATAASNNPIRIEAIGSSTGKFRR